MTLFQSVNTFAGQVYPIFVVGGLGDESIEYAVSNELPLKMYSGTGFFINKNENLTFLTAAHTVIGLDDLNWRTYLSLENKLEYNEYSPIRVLNEVIRENSFRLPNNKLNENSQLPESYIKKIDVSHLDISDFYKYNSLNHNFLDDSFRLRDLNIKPLQLNEPLKVIGMRLGKKYVYNCLYVGLNNSEFVRNRRLRPLLDCDNLPNNKNELAGISGAPIVDSNGEVIAVFTGGIAPKKNNGQTFDSEYKLTGELLFSTPTGIISRLPLYLPEVHQSFIDFDCASWGDGLTLWESLWGPKLETKACAVFMLDSHQMSFYSNH